MESKYYFPLYPNLISKILLITIRYTQAWCNKKCFLPGGKHLPHDYVDEGNHLLFISKRVVTPSPQIGHHLETEKKQKVQAKEKSYKKNWHYIRDKWRKKYYKKEVSNAEDSSEYLSSDDEISSPIIFKYNTVRSYVSAINELWAHQTFRGLHAAPRPQDVLSALK